MACNVPSIAFKELVGNPVPAPAGRQKVFAKTDGHLYVIDDAGTVRPLDYTFEPVLESIIALEPIAADRIIYTTGVNQFNASPVTLLGRQLLDDATTGAMQSTLGLVIGTDVQAHSADLDSFVTNVSWAGTQMTLGGTFIATSVHGTSGISTNGNLQVDADSNVDGNANFNGLVVIATGPLSLGAGPTFTAGAAVPSALEPEGSIYLRTGGANGSLYVRQAAAWVLK